MSELGPEARSILDAGRDGDAPTSADRARVKQGLLASLAAGGALGAAPSVAEGAMAASTAKVAGAPLLLAAKVLGAATLLGAVGLLVNSQIHRDPPVPSVSIAETLGTAAAPPAASATSLTPTVMAPPPVASSPAEPTAARAPDPIAPIAASSVAIAPSAAVLRPVPKPIAPVATDDPDTLVAETRRLGEAHGALKDGDAEKALALLDQQAAAYAKGELREERAAARVLALCQLGRLDEARAAAAKFLQESPRSPLADRVRAGCPAPRPAP